MESSLKDRVNEYIDHLSGELLSQDEPLRGSGVRREVDEALMNSERNVRFLKELLDFRIGELSLITDRELKDERFKKIYVTNGYFVIGIYELMCLVGMTDEQDATIQSYKKNIERLERKIKSLEKQTSH